MCAHVDFKRGPYGGWLVWCPVRRRGREAFVDANDPVIQRYLGAGWLIPVGSPDELPRGE